MIRAFISIDPPEDVVNKIKEIQDSLPNFKGKKTEVENLHLTLKFLGNIDEKTLELVKQKLRKINFRKFEAEVDSLGVFSPKFIKIIWLHIKGPEKIQSEIDVSLSDLFEKEKRFMSHMTIARVKKIENKKNFLEQLKKIKIPKIKFIVENFKLKKSTPTEEKPIYETIESYSLK
ncbi:MAG: RNA 2',3'-cyclic phosphodiesterase [Candidatus Pacearchaeota archaeon]|nr:MAG: RNA 2',3'-cyclic phosphodiesterase [Candidatus Pacearchaeota archaeon]